MALTPGTRLGVYEVTAPIGEGGMGQVYRATDAKLKRQVAIKVLPPSLAADVDRRARFQREAEVLASLNHPNIAAIYGLEEAKGLHYLVLELVEGETLAERLERGGALPANEALRIVRQMAEALEAAHEKGIVHRDIKPANVMITPGGRVKVLDFGLAKSSARGGPANGESQLSTFTRLATEPGTVLGTPAYMSPEQVRGGAVDGRADIWAVGCVLYELLSGRRPFGGATLPDMLAAVLEHEPGWQSLPPSVTRSLEDALRRCLQKEASRRFQDCAELVAALEDAGAGSAARGRESPGGAGQRVALVVMPLTNLSGDPAQEYFADGMTDALIADLARLRALRVISRRSAMRYKGSDKSLPEIAKELHVDAVVEGSVLREGGRVLIRAQLIEASTDTHLWAASYDRELKDVLILQSEIARSIAREIRIAVTPEERRRLAEARSVDPAAYEAYLKGQFHWSKLTPHDLDRSLDYFEQARGKEPALGLAGIAAVWAARMQMGLVAPAEAGPLAHQAALAAREADETLPEVHYILALISTWGLWDWDAGRAEFERALSLRTNFADARAYHSHFLAIVGRTEEAILEMRLALELDPGNDLFLSLYGIVLIFARDYAEAVRQFQAARLTAPGNPVIHRGLLMALHHRGMFDEAVAELRGWSAAQGDDEVVKAIDQGAGYADSLRGTADCLANRGRAAYVSAVYVAWLYVLAGRNAEAMDWLQVGVERRDPDMPYLRLPIYDPFRGEPRYEALVRRMKLPAA
jgi:TolB-like protein/tetratricopeptide (TPR) repeat protein